MQGDLKFENLVFYAKRIFVSRTPPLRDFEIKPLLGAETKSKHNRWEMLSQLSN